MPNIHKDKLHELTQLIFRTAGATDDHASQVADVLIANNLAGHDSHGILRIPEYLESIKNGEIVLRHARNSSRNSSKRINQW